MMIFTKGTRYGAFLTFSNNTFTRLDIDTGAVITTLAESTLLGAYSDKHGLYDALHRMKSVTGEGVGGIFRMVPCVAPNVYIAGTHLGNFYFMCRLNGGSLNLLGMDFIGSCSGQFSHDQFVINTFDYNAYRDAFYKRLQGVIPLSISKLDMLESAVSHPVSTPFDEYCVRYDIVDKDYEIRRLCSIYQVANITDCYENIIRDFLS